MMQMPEQPSCLPPQAPSYYYAPPTPKPARVLSAHDERFARLSLLMGFLFLRFTVHYPQGFAATAFFVLLYFFCKRYLGRCGKHFSAPQRMLGAVILCFSTVFSLSADKLLHALCFLFILAAQIWLMHAVGSGTAAVTRYLPLDLADSVFADPMREYGAAPQAISATVKRSGTAKTVRTVLIGLLVTVPLTVVVAMLLTSADQGMEDLLSRIALPFTSDGVSLVIELLCAIPVGFWLFGAMFGGARRSAHPLPDDEARADSLDCMRIIPTLGICAGVTPICVLYLFYVITQTSYFFSAFAGSLPQNMIYSEYARRGFFELCAIAVINLIVLLVMSGCSANGKKRRSKALTLYVCLLCGFTLFIIATALAKMLLYIDAYGLTRLRVYTAWFMVLLAIVFLVLMLRQFLPRLHTAKVLSAAFIAMFALLCFSRPDALIAAYNISRYESGSLENLDVKMLCDLSADSAAVMEAHRDTVLAADPHNCYTLHLDTLRGTYSDNPVYAWNLSAQILLHTAQN